MSTTKTPDEIGEHAEAMAAEAKADVIVGCKQLDDLTDELSDVRLVSVELDAAVEGLLAAVADSDWTRATETIKTLGVQLQGIETHVGGLIDRARNVLTGLGMNVGYLANA